MLTCGGVSIFGDPKTDCWILGFDPDPFWSDGPKMNVARDSAAWALDDNFLFVFGGSLGKLNGYTDSVEMYHTVTGNWLEGTPMSSRGEFAAYSVLSVYLRFTSCHNKVFERVLEMPFFFKTTRSFSEQCIEPIRLCQHSRYSHCAVALGNGSIIVTGGYGGLNLAERFDVESGRWTQLPELNPVRAQG